jgi:hypothetical protein
MYYHVFNHKNQTNHSLEISRKQQLKIGILDIEELREVIVGKVAIIYVDTIADACIFEDQPFYTT